MNFEPKWIAWETTRRCNLKCVHCRSSSELDVVAHPDFSLQEAKQIIDKITSYAKPVLVLSGGEPLLREDIFDIAQYGTDQGLRMCLATNGTLVTDEVCLKIKKTNIRMVSLSLDGATAATHDDFRNQKGAFTGTMHAIELFQKYDIPFLVNSSFTVRNRHEIPDIYRLVKEKGATAWYMFMIVPTGRGEEIMEELIPVDVYDEILEWHYQTEKNEDALLMRPTCAPHYYRIVRQKAQEEGETFTRRNLQFSTGGSKGCLAGQLICLIDVDGEVLPCSYFPKSAGNIKTESFQHIWEDAPLFKELRDFKNYKGSCGCCEYVNVCGGCRARAYAMTGDYLAEEPFCSYTPKKMR
ncbi:radical SAM/SPASM domain-containing protein [Desulfotalea psychrophila]|uniref:Related to coenzyme PQQ synthesis protein n=1 Tax=Desulfotalea psychrophila (strain LSv54 / DSM 12343) TaxID=177439 RepID=Q6ANR4_DESPS|nr:radical SAM protein [Desulfotalea psychrophila]CAG36010.1 related to coenzyme PQQ synthesis protein [Desulfotalea psychrophila LSv54]